MSGPASVESWIGGVARLLRGRMAFVWAALPERPRIWIAAESARVGRMVLAGREPPRTARLSLADLEGSFARAIAPHGVVAAVRRRLWEEVRTPFLDGVRIEHVPVCGPTLLAPSSIFRRLVFGQSAAGRLVTISFAEDLHDHADGILSARASFDLVLDRPERALILETPD